MSPAGADARQPHPAERARVLMLAPSFLADRRHKRVHGAEVFNLALARQLVGAGCDVVVGAEPMWAAEFEKHWGDLLAGPSERTADAGPTRAAATATGAGALRVIYGPHLRKPLPVSIGVAARLVSERPFDLLILGNVARGVLPAARLLRTLGKARRWMVISHQYPREAYARRLAGLGVEVMAVSEAVARMFRDAGCRDVWVKFGVGNPEAFAPASRRPAEANPGAPVRFGLVGQLDTPWKGAERVLRAWSARPERLRGRATLHLCAYKARPEWNDPDAVFHDWLEPGEVGGFMRGLDVLIVPSSSSETFSQVMVQGMLAGLPIISSDLEVLAEKLDTGAGLVFRDEGELTAHIARLAEDAGARATMGAEARRVALERYVWRIEDFIARYLA